MGCLCFKSNSEGTLEPDPIAPLVEFGDLLGRGSFGSVYKTVKDGREMAVKVIRKNCAPPSEVQREVRLLKLVKGHPHVVEIDYVTDYNEFLLIYMEYCDQGHLLGYIKRRSPLLDEMINFFLQIVEAVMFIHSKEVIHRDIKPTNVLMKTVNGTVVVKLGDFGVGNVAATLGYFKTCIGSLNYMAPEVIEGKERYTYTADVYSLGIVYKKIMDLYSKYY